MENSLVVAKKLAEMYKDMYGQDIDELKVHKLMYFSQREAYLRSGVPLFEEEFYAMSFVNRPPFRMSAET